MLEPILLRETRVRAILEAFPDDLMLIDAGGHILEYKAGSRDLHLPMEGFLGTDLDELFAPEDAARLMGVVNSVLPDGTSRVLELPIGTRTFEARVAAMESDLALVLFRDVSAEKEAERLKGEFLASVSHELKTPLTAILGFTELLLGGEHSPDELRSFLNNIHYSTQRLADRVNNLLDTSRLEAGRFEITRRSTDLKGVLEEVASSFGGVAQLAKIRLVKELNPLPTLQADPERLAQVVGNLLSNAFKFCPPGGTVWLRAGGEGGGVLLEVEDTGPGIPASEQSRLFNRYARTESAQKRGVSGTGLGLYISKAIVGAHGGRIGLASEAGGGAKFCVWLPVRDADSG